MKEFELVFSRKLKNPRVKVTVYLEISRYTTMEEIESYKACLKEVKKWTFPEDTSLIDIATAISQGKYGCRARVKVKGGKVSVIYNP